MRAYLQTDNSKFSKLICEVFSGHFPARDVSKMNLASLEKFVLRLVEHSTAEMSAKTLSRIKCKDKPKWWPSDVLIDECITKDKIKQFRVTLKQLVANCSNFFKVYSFPWLPNPKPWINDENFNVAGGLKRARNEDYSPLQSIKRRRTLLSSKTISAHVPNSVNTYGDPLQRDLFIKISEPPVESVELDQSGFLKLFDLGVNNNPVMEREQPFFLRQIKFQNCPHIPLSSDTGKLMMKNENYSVPEHVTTRKLERLEWYINKEIPKSCDIKCENNCVPFNKNSSSRHYYKFPKRQLHQMRGNIAYSEFLNKLLKDLVVVLKSEDLLEKKKELDRLKISLEVPIGITKEIFIDIKQVPVNKIVKKLHISKFGRLIKPSI